MRWVRFEENGQAGFGTVADDVIQAHSGDMFGSPVATGRTLPLSAVKLLSPVQPGKIVALWNNFHALAKKINSPVPAEPLYLMKSTTSLIANGETIRKPASYDGKVVFEGELGVVIGRVCRSVSEADAPGHIFGYTCLNDVTAAEIINKDSTFAQWDRAKGFDTFCPMGPAIATGLDPLRLSVRTLVNGEERQNYPVTDMVFPPARLVAEISRCVTLLPGDVIACGTSVGVGSLKPGSRVEVVIEGIGTLSNAYQ